MGRGLRASQGIRPLCLVEFGVFPWILLHHHSLAFKGQTLVLDIHDLWSAIVRLYLGE